MKFNSQHSTGFALSLLFHGVILTSLLVGQMSSQSSAKPSESLSISLAMFQAETLPSVVEVVEKIIPLPAKPVAIKPAVVKPAAVKKIVPNKTLTLEEKHDIEAIQEKPSPPIDKPTTDITQQDTPEQTTEEIVENEQTKELDTSSTNSIASAPASSLSSTNKPVTDHGLIETLEAEYMAALRKAIEAKKHYPKRARRLKREGNVIIDFTIHRDGKINQIQVQNSSGTKMLDKAAVDAIKRLGQFKPIPDKIPRDSWALEIPITYALR